MIITIAHTKGGVGKSTTTWHIICELQRLKKDFIIIDLDHQRTVYNLDNFLREKSKEFKVFTPTNISELHSLVTQHKDKLIIIDTGGNGDSINKKAMQIADKIITPIGNDSITEVIGFKKFEAILQELNNPNINILFCNIFHSTKNFNDILDVVSGYKNTTILKSIIRHRGNYKSSMGRGLGITEVKQTKNKSDNDRLKKSQIEIKNLIKELEI